MLSYLTPEKPVEEGGGGGAVTVDDDGDVGLPPHAAKMHVKTMAYDRLTITVAPTNG